DLGVAQVPAEVVEELGGAATAWCGVKGGGMVRGIACRAMAASSMRGCSIPPRNSSTGRCSTPCAAGRTGVSPGPRSPSKRRSAPWTKRRSEEHTSELQSLAYLVCRLLLEKKNTQISIEATTI